MSFCLFCGDTYRISLVLKNTYLYLRKKKKKKKKLHYTMRHLHFIVEWFNSWWFDANCKYPPSPPPNLRNLPPGHPPTSVIYSTNCTFPTGWGQKMYLGLRFDASQIWRFEFSTTKTQIPPPPCIAIFVM